MLAIIYFRTIIKMKTKPIIQIMAIWCILCTSQVFSQPIPVYQLVDWSVAGLLEEIPEPLNMVNVLDYGAFGDGIHNDSPAIQEAINDLNENAGILYFPSGSYFLIEPIVAYSGLVIRGEGADETNLKFFLTSDNQNAIIVSASQTSEFQGMISGYEMGSFQIEISNTNGLEAGDFLELRQENGDWDIVPINWAEKVVGQIVQIASINGNEITLVHPLRFEYSGEFQPEIRKIEAIQNVKIENLKIERLDEPQDGGGKNMYFAYAVNCQISGVESVKSQGSHIYLTHSSNVYIFGNYLHDAFLYDGVDTRGYGITLNMHSGEVLVENNIFKNLRHSMVVKTGANGNVFSYNYSREPHRSEPISDFCGDISLHGHYAYANLFEENICQNIIIDHYWGPSGPNNTFFRNRTELYGLIMTSNSISETHNQCFVGNEIANSFPYGFYTLTGSGHFEYGNNDGGTCIPAGTSDLEDMSYFYSERPWFLDMEFPFPAIGFPSLLNQYSNPAKERWLAGGQMTVELEHTVGVEQIEKQANFVVQIRENPCRHTLFLDIQNFKNSSEYRIYNINGQLEQQGIMKIQQSEAKINIGQLSSGVYLIQIQSKAKSQVLKFSISGQ